LHRSKDLGLNYVSPPFGGERSARWHPGGVRAPTLPVFRTMMGVWATCFVGGGCKRLRGFFGGKMRW